PILDGVGRGIPPRPKHPPPTDHHRRTAATIPVTLNTGPSVLKNAEHQLPSAVGRLICPRELLPLRDAQGRFNPSHDWVSFVNVPCAMTSRISAGTTPIRLENRDPRPGRPRQG